MRQEDAWRDSTTERRDGPERRATINYQEGKMIEWFVFIAAVVLPLVVARCIAFGMGGNHERN